MNRLLTPLLTRTPDFDPITRFPEDVERLVAVAINAGYRLAPRDAAELWRRHAVDECESWIAVTGNDQDILAALLKHAEIRLDVAYIPPPPVGYASWLEFSVDVMYFRAEEIDRLVADAPISRQCMRDAVRAELVALRRKAGEL